MVHTQLDKVSNSSHDDEADADSLANLEELALVGLRAAVDELCAILEEVARDVEEFLDLI